ncbi:MAG: hypothetical protein FWC32_10040 [Firmicutes bacterium]|nr:hypothetical protein [Bacillota bacterium]
MNKRLYRALCGEPFANKWLRQALIFRESATTLNSKFHHTKMPIFMSFEIRIPAMVLSSFACELSLKGMLKADKIPQSHNLKKLFGALKGKTQNVIINNVSNRIDGRRKAKLEAEFIESKQAVYNNDASSAEQKEQMLAQLEKMQKEALDKKATNTVDRQNPEVTKLETMLYYLQSAELDSDAKNMLIAELHKKLETLDKTITVVERTWFGNEEFYAELKKHSNAFEDWRYAHQTGEKQFYPFFMEYFLDSILEFCEEHDIFSNNSPDY